MINQKDDLQNKDKIYAITAAIAEEESKENHEKILKNFKSLININLQQMCKKVWPKWGVTLPTAKRNQRGK